MATRRVAIPAGTLVDLTVAAVLEAGNRYALEGDGTEVYVRIALNTDPDAAAHSLAPGERLIIEQTSGAVWKARVASVLPDAEGTHLAVTEVVED